jgi:hypothetical protein
LDRPLAEQAASLQSGFDDLDARGEVARAGHRLDW